MSDRIHKLKFAKELEKMSSNILKKLVNWKVHRIRVNFKSDSKNFDTFIGRKAHIEFIDNPELVKTFLYMFDDIF